MSRSRKTSKAQMELLINYLEKNKILITGKCHPLNVGEVDSKWEELTNMLNLVENGARKNKKQWKTFLYEWKSKTKRKCRNNTKSIQQTGGGGYTCVELNELENRLMSVFGWVHVIGCPGTPQEVDPDDTEAEPILEQVHLAESPLPDDISFADEEQTEIIDVIVEDYPVSQVEELSGTKKTGVNRKVLRPNRKKRLISSNATKLDSAAEKYSQSTEQMTLAIKEMAHAISHLAEAFTKIANALSHHSISKSD